MGRRLMDIILSCIGLVLLSPILLIAAIGVKVSSRGPVLYRARRVGRQGKIFTMFKFRTMHVQHTIASPITSTDDPRVYRFGAWLRKTKIDELPQLYNILRGDMALVGPRAEDPDIVEHYYTAAQRQSLAVRPGLSSPGSLYYYAHEEKNLMGEEALRYYLERLLPVKLALDMVYIHHASPLYDLAIIWRTVTILAKIALGKAAFPDPPEMEKAREFVNELQSHMR